ncbi:MAG: hypothetical protein M1831_006522 [Alyxoria varia]|nr:MAG: hypothetical protein M1831_006522 [Alyxoria varia]
MARTSAKTDLINSKNFLVGAAPPYTTAECIAMASKDAQQSGEAATSSNPRGIPLAPFVDKVEDYVSSRAEVESTLKRFQELISKYQFMQANTEKRLSGLKEKVPDIRKTLDMVRFLQTRQVRRNLHHPFRNRPDSEPLDTLFELNDTLYAKAEVPHTDEVYLWLGANIMLSYPIDEASELLNSKLQGAKQKIEDCEEDLDFLREQITLSRIASQKQEVRQPVLLLSLLAQLRPAEKVYITFPTAFWDAHTDETSVDAPSPDKNSPPSAAKVMESSRSSTKPTNTQALSCFANFLRPSYSPQNPESWALELQSLSNPTVFGPHARPTLLFTLFGPCASHITSLITSKESSSPSYQGTLRTFFEPYYALLPNYNDQSPECRPSEILATNWHADDLAGNGTYTNFKVREATSAQGKEEFPLEESFRALRRGVPERGVWVAGASGSMRRRLWLWGR